jgi:hypothetical protein
MQMGETAFDASTNVREASTIFYFLRLRQDSFISAESLFFDSRMIRYFFTKLIVWLMHDILFLSSNVSFDSSTILFACKPLTIIRRNGG